MNVYSRYLDQPGLRVRPHVQMLKHPKPRQVTPSRRPGGKLRQHLRNAYREAILDAAETVFEGHGYHEAKMAQIAEDAGMAVGTLYKYFESKRAIFDAISERARQVYAELLQPVRDVVDPIGRVRGFIAASFAFIQRYGALYSIGTQLGDERDEAAVAAREEALSLVRTALVDGRSCGLFRAELDVELAVVVLSGAMQGVISSWLATERGFELESRTEPLLGLLLDGLRASEKPGTGAL